MNLLDYIIIIAMAFLLVKGIFRGFIREVSSLVGIILGIWLANLFQPDMTDFLGTYLPSGRFLPLISFAVLFIVVLILCNILGWGLKLLFKKILLGWADRILGACLAIIKGVVVTYLVIVVLTFFLPAKTPLIAGSLLTPWIIKSYQTMIGLISPDHYQNWKRKILGEKEKIGTIMPGIKDIENYNE